MSESARGRLKSDGMGVVEVLIAIVLFSVATMMGGRFIVYFIQQVSVSETRAQATEFALEELEQVRFSPYEEILPIAAAPVPEDPNYIRRVDVVEVGADDPTALYNYRIITVTVSPPGDLNAVRVTTAVSP